MKIFVLQNPKAGNGSAVTDFLPSDGSRFGDAPRCRVCGKYVGMLTLLPPVRVEVEAWGTQWGDIAFGPGDQLLVSEKLRALSATNDLIGFENFDPVDIKRMKRHKSETGAAPQYWLASIQRSQTKIDDHASGLIREERPTCDECSFGGVIKRFERIALVSYPLPEEDIFFARGLPGTVLTSERFKRLCEVQELANCEFVAAEEFSVDHYRKAPKLA